MTTHVAARILLLVGLLVPYMTDNEHRGSTIEYPPYTGEASMDARGNHGRLLTGRADEPRS